MGQLVLSSKLSHSALIYKMLIGSLGKNYKVTKGSREDAWCYATAKRLGYVRYLLEHAGYQLQPLKVFEMMAYREQEYGIVPGQNDSLYERRQVLAARELLPRGARREAVVDALSTLLGSDFLGYRTTLPAEIVNWPTSLGDQPMNLQLPTVPRKVIRITTAITTGLGAPQDVSYSPVDLFTFPISAGDKFVVQPENPYNSETITVSAVGELSIVATFNKPHPPNVLATTQPYPMWCGTQRASLIFVSMSASVDPEKRRKINELMERIARGVSTWAIVGAVPGPPPAAGPFVLNQSPLTATPFASVTP